VRILSTFRAGSFAALVIASAAVAVLDSSPADAQQYGTPVVTQRPSGARDTRADESAREASVLRRPSPDSPAGFAVGSFVLYPRLEIDGEYDDNVFRTRNNREDDFIFRVRPGFSLVSDWSLHGVEFYAQGEIGRYVNFGSESYEAFTVGGRTRFDITDELAWVADGDISRNRLSRGAPGIFGGPIGPNTIVNTYTAGTALVYSGDPLFWRIGPRFTRADYVKGTPDSQNFNLYEIAGRVGYRVTPDFSVFIDPSYQWVRYDEKTDPFGFKQNSEGFDIRFGIAYDVAQTVTAELGVGYFRRTYDDSRFKPEDGLSLLARLYWNPTDLVSVEAEARRSLSQYRTTINNIAAVGNAIETYVGLRVGWEAAPALVVDAGGAFAHYEYRGQNVTERYWYFDVGARYYLNANFYVGPRYFYERRDASPSSLNYTDNRFLLTIGAQL
jgi:hypothetical protein